MKDINLFGQTSYRGQSKKFGIKADDRRRHFYVIGKTGMGKTELLKTMIVQDIVNGRGVGFVDPHGEAAEEILDYIPKERIKDVCYFNPGDINFPISFNVMEKVDVELRHLVASGLMEVFKKIWPDVWSARMEYILHNCILALLEYPGSTLLGVNRMLADENYRAEVVDKIKDPVVKAFWLQEFARYTQRYEIEATAAIQNKIGQFISSPLIRNIIGQVESSVDMREIMDKEKILILNLSKGRIGEESSKLLGGLLITKLQLAAMSRVDILEPERKDFFLYVDEFQNFATVSFVNILSEARKYRLNLILAHQYITQMEEPVRDAVFGNVGTLLSFRVGAEDAEFLEREFTPEFTAMDLVNLPKRAVYLKLIVDGVAGRPFSAKTLDAFEKPKESFKEQIIAFSREKFAQPRADVEDKIARWTGNFARSENAPALPTRKETQMFEARCVECGKTTRVPFKPAPDKPIYCKTCLKKIQSQREVKNVAAESKKAPSQAFNSTSLSLEDLLTQEPVSFSRGKKDNSFDAKKKSVNKTKLHQIIQESLAAEDDTRPGGKDILPSEQVKDFNKKVVKKKSGEIKPGEIIEL